MKEVDDQYTGFEMHLDFGRAAECEIFILRRRFMLVYVTNSTPTSYANTRVDQSCVQLFISHARYLVDIL